LKRPAPAGDLAPEGDSAPPPTEAAPLASADLPLDEVPLPARMQTHARAMGLRTLGELARIDPADLMKRPHLGRLTVHRTRRVIEPLLGRPWGARVKKPAAGEVRHAALLALLHGSATPVPLRTAAARFGKLRPLEQSEILFFPERRIGLARHFPDHAQWVPRIVSAVLEVLESAPARPWHARELHDLLRPRLRLPPWLTHVHVGSVLLRSERVRWVGRWQFALPGAADVTSPLSMRERVVHILRAHGEPMPRAALVAELRRASNARDTNFRRCLSQPGVLRCARGRIGLVDRDLPGGRKAAAKAAAHAVALLERRRRGLTLKALHAELRALSPAHAKWTQTMCLGALRIDPRFRTRQGGRAIGLASWESVRLPTAEEVVRRCLQHGGGTVLVETVRRRVREQRGETLSRWRLSAIANGLGAGLHGPWLAPMQKRSPQRPSPAPKGARIRRPRAGAKRPRAGSREA
jgi:hypothetical protein